MAGLQNSNKLFTDSSNTNPALTTASTHYSQPPRHPTTPTSPTLSNTTTSPRSSSETLRSNKGNNKTSPTTTTTSTNSTPPSNPTSSVASRSLTSTATQTTPQPHSAFSPYNQIPQHPTPVTTPTTTKNSLSQSEPPTMMTTSHLDNSGSTALIYPQQHPHFANSSTTHFWPSWNFNGGNPPNGAAVLPTTGGSAFVPAVGYGTGSNMAPGHNPRPKLTTTIWEDEGTLCYQVDARGICVARRQDNNMINGTKLLNVVGMSRGKRDGILKNEKGRVVVKVGAMHLKGVWITFARAKTLATQFKISELLYPLFVDDPSVFLHNSYGPSMSSRIPALNNGAASQWRPTHPYASNFNSPSYTPETTRQWYPYGNGNPLMGSPNGPHGQEHGSVPYPPATAYGERPQNVATPPAVPIYSQPPRNHGHPQHLEYETGYGLINGQSQGQQGVTVVSGPATEENPSTNGNGYMRPSQGLYNLVSAADVVGGSPAQNNSPQILGQKRSFVSEDENEDYNSTNQPSPPLPIHPPPPMSGIAVSNAMNAAAGSFPSPSPTNSPNNSAFSGWNHKRVKYEFSEATTPSSSQSSPRNSTPGGYQLPGLGAGPATPGANPSTPAYTSSNLQMVTNASSPHHYSSATSNGGTPTPTHEGLDRYIEHGAVLHTSSPENVGNAEESRRYEQYRQREDPPATEDINGGWE